MDEVERLIEQLGAKEWGYRFWAVEGLRRIGNARVVDPLCQALVDENELVRERAKAALEKMGSQAVDLLYRMLEDRDRNVRKAVAEALGNIGRREALPALKARLRISWLGGEQDENVRTAIRAAIEKIETATAAAAALPIPATTPTPDAHTLPRSAAAPTHEVDKLPRPANDVKG